MTFPRGLPGGYVRYVDASMCFVAGSTSVIQCVRHRPGHWYGLRCSPAPRCWGQQTYVYAQDILLAWRCHWIAARWEHWMPFNKCCTCNDQELHVHVMLWLVISAVVLVLIMKWQRKSKTSFRVDIGIFCLDADRIWYVSLAHSKSDLVVQLWRSLIA